MRLVIFRSLVVLAVGAAVLVGVLYVASTVDARSPEVIGFELTQSLPDHPETAVITTSLEVAFNEPVLLDAGADPLSLAPNVEGTVSWSGSTLIFTPREPLELETEYVATVGDGIRDAAGNHIGDPPPSFSFTTAGRPEVVQTLPEDGSSVVPVETEISIEFSTLMDTGSVADALSIEPAVPHELRWSGEVLEVATYGPLDADQKYSVRIGGEAADVAGVQIGEAVVVSFRTVVPGLEPVSVLPADGVDGIAPSAPLAVVFDRAIDPDSVSNDLLTIAPDVAGSLEVVTVAGEPVDDVDPLAGVVLRFAPSGLLPLNTTFDVTLAPGLRAVDGGSMAEQLAWTFTTGAPAATLSNQITFITDRGGVANVWAMNPDGSGQHQVSTELGPILDYAVAPDGSRIVVADGRRLIGVMADGSARSVFTEEGFLEFDPAFAPNGQRLAFGRADAENGEGLGLWISSAEGDDATRVELPSELGAEPTASASGDEPGPGWLRAPSFSPDGQALAFVDPEGWIAILELPAERLTRVEANAAAPIWLPDSSAIVFTRNAGGPGAPPAPGAAVSPLSNEVEAGTMVALMSRSGTTLQETALRRGVALAGVDRDGRLASLDASGALHLSEGPDDRGRPVPGLDDARVIAAAFATGQEDMVVIVGSLGGADARSGTVEVLDLETGERTIRAPQGGSPRWLP